MSVLPGEGTHDILYGSTGFAARTRILPGYLARPDLAGSHPAVVLVPPPAGITSSVKDLCRRLGRRGLAVAAPDLYRGAGPKRGASAADVDAALADLTARRVLADLDAVLAFLRRPGTEWADPRRIGVIGMGRSGRWAIDAVRDNSEVRALALAYVPLAGALDVLPQLGVSVLGLYGRADEIAPAEDAASARGRLPASQWVIYEGVDHGFLDDAGETYDPAAASDAIDRLASFFGRALSLEPPAATGGG